MGLQSKPRLASSPGTGSGATSVRGGGEGSVVRCCGHGNQFSQLLLLCKSPCVQEGRHGSSTQGSTRKLRGPRVWRQPHSSEECHLGVGPVGSSSQKGLEATISGSHAPPPRELWPASTSPGPALSLPWSPATSSAQCGLCRRWPPEASHPVPSGKMVKGSYNTILRRLEANSSN